MSDTIALEFHGFSLEAELFDSRVGRALHAALPKTIPLTYWGAEAYGSIGADLGQEAPQSKIPAGGIAYTNQGNYLCLFFGQDPAWPVEYVGQISGESWKQLAHQQPQEVTVKRMG